MTKKILALLLAATMIFALTACTPSSDSGTGTDLNESTANTPTEKAFKIGIIQIVEHPSLNEVREALIDQLATLGYVEGDKITLDYQNAQGDQTNLNTISQKFVSGNYDLIVAIATPSAQAAQGATDTIPIIFSAVTDPVGAGLVESNEKPGKNISGTSDWISAAQLMDLANQITPNIKKIGALYSLGEANSVSTVNDLKVWALENNVEVVDAAFVNSNEVQTATESLLGKVDAIFIPTDNTCADAMPIIADVANGGKVPVFVGADTMVVDGGLASYGVNYTELGKETANMVVEVLEGAKIGDLPVKTMEQMNIYVNTDTAEKLGATIPEDILAKATKVGE